MAGKRAASVSESDGGEGLRAAGVRATRRRAKPAPLTGLT
jgi:hypothetical protein